MAAADTIVELRGPAAGWRRKRLCLLVGVEAAPAALRHVDGRGAFLETGSRPPLGSAVELRHPEAGSIAAEVAGATPDGIRLTFPIPHAGVAFALTAVAADMTRPV